MVELVPMAVRATASEPRKGASEPRDGDLFKEGYAGTIQSPQRKARLVNKALWSRIHRCL
jgi:hypothetical protein